MRLESAVFTTIGFHFQLNSIEMENTSFPFQVSILFSLYEVADTPGIAVCSFGVSNCILLPL